MNLNTKQDGSEPGTTGTSESDIRDDPRAREWHQKTEEDQHESNTCNCVSVADDNSVAPVQQDDRSSFATVLSDSSKPPATGAHFSSTTSREADLTYLTNLGKDCATDDKSSFASVASDSMPPRDGPYSVAYGKSRRKLVDEGDAKPSAARMPIASETIADTTLRPPHFFHDETIAANATAASSGVEDEEDEPPYFVDVESGRNHTNHDANQGTPNVDTSQGTPIDHDSGLEEATPALRPGAVAVSGPGGPSLAPVSSSTGSSTTRRHQPHDENNVAREQPALEVTARLVADDERTLMQEQMDRLRAEVEEMRRVQARFTAVETVQAHAVPVESGHVPPTNIAEPPDENVPNDTASEDENDDSQATPQHDDNGWRRWRIFRWPKFKIGRTTTEQDQPVATVSERIGPIYLDDASDGSLQDDTPSQPSQATPRQRGNGWTNRFKSRKSRLCLVVTVLVVVAIVTVVVVFSLGLFDTSPEPARAPMPPLEPGEAAVTISVTTDEYPHEISWGLIESSGAIVASVSAGDYSVSNHLYETVVNLPSGDTFTFTIFDTASNGIFAPGGYEVTANGVILASGGEYDALETTTFAVPTLPPALESTSSPKPGEAAVTISVTTDEFPQEISWGLIEDAGVLVASVSPGNYTLANHLYETVVNLQLGDTYTFTIFDTASNGIVEPGGYEVTANGVILASGGEYGALEATEFVVPD